MLGKEVPSSVSFCITLRSGLAWISQRYRGFEFEFSKGAEIGVLLRTNGTKLHHPGGNYLSLLPH